MPSRRDLLLASAGLAGLLAAPGVPSRLLGVTGRTERAGPAGLARTRALRLLNRLGYGPRPGDLERVISMGCDAYIEEQLSPSSIPDWKNRLTVRRVELASLEAPDLRAFPASEVLGELRRTTVLRALGSERQLLEVMVEFWSDHFNIDAEKGGCAWLKVIDDRDVIRRHALGSFRDLLRAALESPAMLVYLDGDSNRKGSPNENHARELLELHTLGVSGGYGQADVRELSRALTGWRLGGLFNRGERVLDLSRHDAGEATLLGVRLPGDSKQASGEIVERLSSHPSTSRFVSEKLCRRFVGEDPPAELVEKVASAFRKTRGDIRGVLGTLLHSPELLSAPVRLKRPYTFAVSALRALEVSADAGKGLQDEMRKLGQIPFGWPTPDGPPEEAAAWSGRLLARWNFAFRLFSSKVRGARIPRRWTAASPSEVLGALLQRPVTPDEEAVLNDAGDRGRALALCHPEFQMQ